jgi:hypothetical protein
MAILGTFELIPSRLRYKPMDQQVSLHLYVTFVVGTKFLMTIDISKEIKQETKCRTGSDRSGVRLIFDDVVSNDNKVKTEGVCICEMVNIFNIIYFKNVVHNLNYINRLHTVR